MSAWAERTWPVGRVAWCDSDCTDDASWRGWVRVLEHRGGLTYIVSTDLARAFWLDWTRGHLFAADPCGDGWSGWLPDLSRERL